MSLDQLRPEQRAQVERSLALAHKIGNVRTVREGVEVKQKHRNIRIEADGGRFDSKLEEREYRKLEARQHCGQIRNLRRQVKFSLFIDHGEHLQTYRADFTFEELQGGKEWRFIVADAKSRHTRKLPGWQKIKTLMLNCHGHSVRELP